MDASTVILGAVYGGFALFYIAMLCLTERSADRYVRGETPRVNELTSIYILDAPEAEQPSRDPAAELLPASGVARVTA